MDARQFLTDNENATEVTRRMLAAMAVLGYKGGNLGTVPGIRELDAAPQAEGYDAIVVHHQAARTLVYVNRGAEGFKSVVDLIEGAEAAIAAKFKGPLQHSVEFLDSGMKALATSAGLNGVKAQDVDEVLTTGHSWGGALAEAQVTLGPSVIGKYLNSLPIAGLGIGSAGFARAIEGMCRDRSVSVPPDMDWKMNHYVRRADVIMMQPDRRVLGQTTILPSIYQAFMVPPRRGFGNEYHIQANPLLNHSQELYFEHFEQPGDKHFYRRRSGEMLLRDEAAPARWDYGTTNPDPLAP
jgi:hypothetical protein